jgi:thioredoxin 1
VKAVVLGFVLALALAVVGCGAPTQSTEVEAATPADSVVAAPDTAVPPDSTPAAAAPAGGTAPAAKPAPAPVLKAALPVLYDFWATWCPPCREQKPIIEELKSDYAGRVDVVAVNVDEQGELAKQYGIKVIPTLVLLDAAGNEVERLTGLTAKDKLIERFRAHGFIE